MKIEDLKQGDLIYNIKNFHVYRYEYLCVHPHNKKYYIFIDEYENPIRMFYSEIEKILNLNLKSNNEAEMLLANMLENEAKEIREYATNNQQNNEIQNR